MLVVTLLSVTPERSSSEFVFTKFNNNTGSDNLAYVCIIGMLMASFSVSGYEGGAHLAEETKNASVSAPRGIVLTCLAASVTGFVYIIGLLFAMRGNIDAVNDGPNNQAVVNVFYIAFTDLNGSTNKNGVLAMALLLMLNIFFSGFSNMTVTSRIGFAMARDYGLPFSSWLQKTNESTKTPLNMILMSLIIDIGFCLMILLNETAFVAVTSITTIGYHISYAIPIFLRTTFGKRNF